MVVCHCKRVNDATVRQAVRAGARSVQDVGGACAAGTGCGGCRPLIHTVIDEELGTDGSLDLVALRQAS